MSFDRSSALEAQPSEMRREEDPEYRGSIYDYLGIIKTSLTE